MSREPRFGPGTRPQSMVSWHELENLVRHALPRPGGPPVTSNRPTYKDIAECFGLTSVEADALQWALHLDRTIHAATSTGRSLRKSTMRRLLDRHLVEEIVAAVVDGDGFIVFPERERIAYRLTDEGRKLAEKLDDAEKSAVYDVLVG